MKQFFCLLFFVALFACKKDGSGSGSQKMLLAKIFRKGLIEQENFYSTDGKKIRTDFYTSGGGIANLSTYRLYNYNEDGTLKEAFHYSKDHYATVRKIYSYNAQKKVTRIDEATIFTGDDDLDNIDYFEVFTYDNKGQLTQVTRRLINNTMHSTDEYEYDDKGNLILNEGRYWDNGAMVLKQKLELEPGPKQMPEHWKNNLVVPTDDNLYEHYLNKKTYTSWWAGELVGVYTYPAPVYNTQGYLTSNTYHYKSGATESDIEMTYEYVQQ
jgi:hypothetical protein